MYIKLANNVHGLLYPDDAAHYNELLDVSFRFTQIEAVFRVE